MRHTVADLNVAADWLRDMDYGAQQAGINIQYCMTLQRELLQSVELPSVNRIRASEDYLLVEDQWKIGITSHITQAIGVKPYKDVFWTSRSNPGNLYYYDCMEVSLDTDTDTSPWPINYRYVGPINQTSESRKSN